MEIAAHYRAIRASLVAAGTPIGNNDLWIAAAVNGQDLGVLLALVPMPALE
jgi:predicted nucleic acid-binding protein